MQNSIVAGKRDTKIHNMGTPKKQVHIWLIK